MRVVSWLATLFVLLGALSLFAQSPPCNVVVKTVGFEDRSGLNPVQRTALNQLLVGLCFQREHPEVLSRVVYEQLLTWGFKHATVYDPDHGGDIRVLAGC